MDETPKTIRSKMYSFIIKKGIVIDTEDRKEIRVIMDEYRNYNIPERVKKEPEWKPYPDSE